MVGCVRLELVGGKFFLVQVHKGKDFLCTGVGHIAEIEFLLIFPILLAFEAEGQFVRHDNPNIVSLQPFGLVNGGKSNHISGNVVSEKVVQLRKDFRHIGASSGNDFDARNFVHKGNHKRGGIGIHTFAFGTATGKFHFVVKFLIEFANGACFGLIDKGFQSLANITAFDIGRNAIGNEFEAEAHKGGRLPAKYHITGLQAVETGGMLDFALASTLKGIEIGDILLCKVNLSLTATIADGKGEFVIIGLTGKVGKRIAVRSGKAVDCLHRVAYGHETAIGGKGGKEQFLLCLVQVLCFIHEDKVVLRNVTLCRENAGGNHIHEINRSIKAVGRRKASGNHGNFVTREVKAEMVCNFLNPTDFTGLDKIYTALVKQVLAVADKAVFLQFTLRSIGKSGVGKDGKVGLDIIKPFLVIGHDTAFHGLHQSTKAVGVQGLAIHGHRQTATEFVHNAFVESKEQDGHTGISHEIGTFHDGCGLATSGNGIDGARAVFRVLNPFKDCGLKFRPNSLDSVAHSACVLFSGQGCKIRAGKVGELKTFFPDKLSGGELPGCQ